MKKLKIAISLLVFSFSFFIIGVQAEEKNATFNFEPYLGSMIYNTKINSVKVANIDASFNDETNTFSVTVPHTLTTVDSNNITVVKDDPLASLSAIEETNLVPDNNNLTLTMTAQDGTIEIYNLTITKLRDTDNLISSLTLKSGSLTPVFNKNTLTYDVLMPNNVFTFGTDNFDYTLSSNSATSITSNTVNINSETTIPYTIAVTAEDYSVKTYTLNVKRNKSIDTSVSAITVNGENTTYNEKSGYYEITLSNDITTIDEEDVSVTPNDNKALAFKITGSLNLLTKQNNLYTVRIIAENTTISENHIINILRTSSGNNNVEKITVGGVEATYNNVSKWYEVTVGNNITVANNETVNVQLEDDTATISMTPTNLLTTNVITHTVTVTAENGEIKTYILKIVREKSNNADLASLVIPNGVVTQVFDKDTTSYDVTMPGTTKTFNQDNLEATLSSNVASVDYDSQISLQHQNATVYKITVTAEDGITTKIYTLNVKRNISNVTSVDEIKLNEINTSYNNITGNYEITVANNITSIEPDDITVTLSDNDATINKKTGTLSLSTQSINTYVVEVIAEDGVSKQDHTIKVTRTKSSNNAIDSITVGGTLATYNNEKHWYEATVANNITLADENNVVVTTNVDTASVSMGETSLVTTQINSHAITVTAEDGTTANYLIKITRTKSAIATLDSLEIIDGALSETFDKDVLTYDLEMVSSARTFGPSDFTLLPTSNAAVIVKDATIDINDETRTTYKITVTSEDGLNTKVYTLNIIVGQPNTSVSSINVKNLDTNYDENSGTFKITLSNDVTSLVPNDILVVTEDPLATVEKTTGSVLLTTKNTNMYVITVTARDGETTQTHTIEITRTKSSNNAITGIRVGGVLANYNDDNHKYEVTVPNNILKANDSNVIVQGMDSEATLSMSETNLTTSVDGHDHTITVTAEDGTVANYTIHIIRRKSNDATLSNIEILGGSLTPVFEKDTIGYSVVMPSNILDFDENDVTITASSSAATVVKGEKININPNNYAEYLIEVTSEDETRTKIYTLNVKRAKATTTSIEGIKVKGSDTTLNAKTGNYEITVVNSVLSITPTDIEVDLTDDNASYAKTTGTLALITTAINTYNVRVTAEDGVTTEDFAIKITRTKSNNNSITGVSVASLNAVYKNEESRYEVTVPNNVTAANMDNVSVTGKDPTATLTMEETLLTTNPDGQNHTITVTAEDGTVANYVIKIIREKNSDATLSSIIVVGVALDPVFDKNTTSYNVIMPSNVKKFNANSVTSTTSSSTSSVEEGDQININATETTPYYLTVTAEDETQLIYTLNVKRATASVTTISGIKVKNVDATYNTETGNYDVNIANSINEIVADDVVVTPTDANATVQKTTGTLNLVTGNNTYQIKVIAENNTTETSYTINIIRRQSSNNGITSVVIASERAIYNDETEEYEVTVGNNVTAANNTNVVVTLADQTASYGMNETILTTAETGNVHTITVTAEDGTVANHIVRVTRLKNSDATLASLLITGGTLDSTFNKDTMSYDVLMSSSSTTFNPNSVTATATNSSASVEKQEQITINSETSTAYTITVTAEDGYTTKTYTLNIKCSAGDAEITSNEYGHVIASGYITDVHDSVLVSTLLTQFDNPQETLEVWKADDSAKVEDDRKVGTGMILKLKSGATELHRLTIVVKGDVNGDGVINPIDGVKILNHYLKSSTIPEGTATYMAANTNSDSTINPIDGVKVLNHYLKKASLY